MIANFNTSQTIAQIAQYLMIAAQTAPKGRGIDTLTILSLAPEEQSMLVTRMKEMSVRDGLSFFARDADNIAKSDAVILVGTKGDMRGLNCALCGFSTCAEKPLSIACVFNTVDLGIALGSLVSSAAGFKVDNRIMFSAGQAAIEQRLLDDNVLVAFAVPLAMESKSIFFDRG
jgi:uncharacterized ferredoxin-like protein